MTSPKKRLTVTAVNGGGIITAFFNEMPGLVVQGNEMNDVKQKLNTLLESYIQRLDSMKGNIDIQTKSLA